MAGCGASSPRARPAPRIPAAVASQLSADAAAVAATSGCAAHDAAAKLQADAIASISRVPSRYREPIMSAANEIAGRAPACAPAKKEHPKPPDKHKPPEHKHHGPHGHD
ncbi:MAG: hypothetical protein ACXVZN_09610 [Gaiellaceae bacterium]